MQSGYNRFAISIHALREEGDGTNQAICQLGYQFLSTPSVRRATASVLKKQIQNQISIHALREEGDAWSIMSRTVPMISIHALREEGDR